jgi:hypothetical protein
MGTEPVPETLDQFYSLTWLVAGEDFIESIKVTLKVESVCGLASADSGWRIVRGFSEEVRKLQVL